MATCVIIGSPETRIIERGDKPALVYTPRFSAGSRQMIDHRGKRFDGFGRRHVRQGRPADHDHLDAKRPRRGDLAIGRLAAAVLGDDDIDAMVLEQRAFVRLAERPARQQIGRIGHRQRRLDRIDAADEIVMLRRGLEGGDLLPAERQEDPARRRSPSACTASPTVSTSVQRSPSTGSQPGRRSARIGTPASRAACAALAEIRAA